MAPCDVTLDRAAIAARIADFRTSIADWGHLSETESAAAVSDIEALLQDCVRYRNRLASYDACLAEVREERSQAKEIISRARRYITDAEINILLHYIEDLQRSEAANRNALKVAQETIAMVTRERDEARDQNFSCAMRIERLEAALRQMIDCAVRGQSMIKHATLTRAREALAAADGQQDTCSDPDPLQWLQSVMPDSDKEAK